MKVKVIDRKKTDNVTEAIKHGDADLAVGLIATQEQIDKIAADVRRSGVPDELNRWLGMTPIALRTNQAMRTRIINKQRETKMSTGPKESALREARQTNLNDKDKAAIEQMKAADEKAKAEKAKAKKAEQKENKLIREKQRAAAKAAKTGKAQAHVNGKDVTVMLPPKPKKTVTEMVSSSGRKGAFNDKVVAALVPLVKKGCTVGDLIAAGRKAGWGQAADPVKRAFRFIKTVANEDLHLKAKINGKGEEAKVSC